MIGAGPRRAALWLGGIALSLGGHGALLLLLAAAIAPDPPPPGAVQGGTFDITSYPVRESREAAQAPDADALSEDTTGGVEAAGVAVPQAHAEPEPVEAPRLAEARPEGGALAAQTDDAAPLIPLVPAGEAAEAAPPLSAVEGESAQIAEVAPETGRVAPEAMPPDPLVLQPAEAEPGLALSLPTETAIAVAARPDAPVIESALAPAAPLETLPPAGAAVQPDVARPGVGLAAVPVSAAPVETAPVVGAVLRDDTARADAQVIPVALAPTAPLDALAPAGAAVRPEAARPDAAVVAAPVSAAPMETAPLVGALLPDGAGRAALPGQLAALPATPAPGTDPAGLAQTSPSLTPPSARGTAALAWSGEGGSALDPVSLAAIQAFSREGDPTAGSGPTVRDGIGALLSAVPCARVQTVFDPDTGTLSLRGHVPDDGLRAPVLAALGEQVGPSIPLRDDLLILPRPQCGVLTGIAAVGLAQSDEQEGDPRVVGQPAFSEVLRFAGGDSLSFDVQGADYPAYVYVDYFDAGGNVLHLQPNGDVPLRVFAPKEVRAMGLRADGTPIEIEVAPPFGQEIMVTFAASRPLYSETRPVFEAAEPYLTFLRERVAAARAADPSFRGEWYYFFVATAAR